MKETNLVKDNNTITTLEIAEMMDTQHYKILEKLEGTKDKKTKGIIPTLTAHEIVVSDYFIQSSYIDASGKENKCYLVTKLGCDFLANKFTGEKGILFTAKYVKRFAEMEKTIREFESLKATLLLSIYEGGQDAVVAAKQLSDLEVEEATKPLIEQIEEDKPKVDVYNALAEPTVECVDVDEFSKTLAKQGVKMGRNTLFRWLRDNKYLMRNNIPYQTYINRNYFQVIEGIKNGHLYLKTLITGKGQIALLKKLLQSA